MNNVINPPAIVETVDLAESLTVLSSVIERNAIELARIKNDLKLKRESLKDVFQNDSGYQSLDDAATQAKNDLKVMKQKLSSEPQIVSLKVGIDELKEQAKEVEQSLSNHLLNYHQMTNSRTFDATNGEQFDFEVSAKVKIGQLKLFGN